MSSYANSVLTSPPLKGGKISGGYSGWLISENFYDRGPVSKLSNDPKALLLKDYQTMKSIAW
jgi:hypothetical protein